MKHLHIIDPYHSAAMQRMTLPFSELAKLYEVTTSEQIDPEADCNLHMPWHTLAGAERGNSKHIIAYTHCNPGAEKQLLEACEKADIVTAMSYEGRRELVRFGVDPAKIWVIYAGADPFVYRRRVIAVVGYPQPNGRKRESLLLDLAWEHDLSGYEFVLVGAGWEEFGNKLASLGVPVQAFHADNQEALQGIYHRIDALLVTGYVEGGPLPVLEAMASGCKVFSPRFGYAADLLTDDCLYDSPADLMAKMDAHFRPALHSHFLARAWTWQDYAAEYALIIGRLLGESVDLYPAWGMPRYAQLLDIIDEIRPQKIVEIGTWKGNTALRMIQQAAKWRPTGDIFYQGFDLFEGQTKEDFRAELSKGGWSQEIVQRRLAATRAGVMLAKGYTRDTLPAYLDASADLFFIDGGHSEATIANDGQLVHSMKPGAVAVFDDYYFDGKPEGMGCNEFVEGLDRNEFKVTFLHMATKADDGRVIGMVRVERRDSNDADIRLQRWQTSTGSYTDYRTGASWASDPLYTPALPSLDA
jgi:predicted O-methyltransferase YrrM